LGEPARKPHPNGSDDRAANRRGATTTRLGKLVVDTGKVSEADLERALQMQGETGERLGNLLVVLELITEDDLVELLGQQYGVAAADLNNVKVPDNILNLVPQEMARRYLVVPVAADSQNLSLAMVDPSDVVAIDDIEFATGLRVQPMVAAERAINEAVGRLYGDQADARMRKMMTDLEDEIRGPGDLEVVEEQEDFDLEAL